MKLKHFILSGIAFAFTAGLSAQSDGTYTIYPVPQKQTAQTGSAAWSVADCEVVCEDGIDAVTRRRLASILTEAGGAQTVENFVSEPTANHVPRIYLGVNGSGLSTDTKAGELGLDRSVFAKASKYDRHLVYVGAGAQGQAQIVILGENTDAAFYGLASLEQMLEQVSEGAMPCVAIYDYADQQNRGIVEGYYGVPYPAEVKKDLMRFMMRHKMNSYMYGAKSDPYHSSMWREAYPATVTEAQRKLGYLSQDMVADINATSHETKVNFIWAIHPGNAFLSSSTVIADVMSKFRKMYALGVRQFAVFVDDVSIPSTQADYQLNAQRVTDLQKAIEKEWNTTYTVAADTVKPLQFVPQIYCGAFAGSEEQRRDFFTALAATPKNVAIYTTGWGVWSVPNSQNVNDVRQYLGRDVAWWWNYPCNDNDGTKLFPADMHTNFRDESRIDDNARVDASLANCLGILSNPMQQGEVSKIPLFGVADYAWNNNAFNNAANHRAAVSAVVTEPYVEALRTLIPYLRYYDGDALSGTISSFKATLRGGNPDPEGLCEVLQQVEQAAAVLRGLETSASESDRLFYTDLSPWLLKLQAMAREGIRLARASALGNEGPEKWNAYVPAIDEVAALDTAARYYAPRLSGSVGANLSVSSAKAEPAAMSLRPFLDYMLEEGLGDYLPAPAVKPERFTNVEAPRGNVTTVNGVAAVNTSANDIAPGQYYGIALPQPVMAEDVLVADTLHNHFHVIYSADGRNWTRYTDKEKLLAAPVKYLCIYNPGSEQRRVILRRQSLAITLPQPFDASKATVTLPSGSVWDNHGAALLVDGDPATFTCLYRNQQAGDAYQLTLPEPTVVGDVRVYMGITNGDHMNAGRVQVSADGNKWTNLYVKGTLITEWKVSLPQTQPYSDEAVYCDFVAFDRTPVKYLRFYLSQPNTSKWLRFHEIEVNRNTYLSKFVAPASDTDGVALAAANDGKGHVRAEAKGGIVYRFLNARPASAVTVYQNAARGIPVTAALEMSSADGRDTETVSLGALGENVTVFDLKPYAGRNLLNLRLSWEGDVAPAIYEIAETADADRLPVVSGIASVETGDAEVSLTVADGRLTLQAVQSIASVEVFALDGRLMLSAVPAACRFDLPRVDSAGGVLTLRVALADHSQRTFKVKMQR